MDMYGFPLSRDSGHIIIMAIGFIQIMAGPGCPAIIGVGRLSITAAGLIITLMGGCGFQDINGRMEKWRRLLWMGTTWPGNGR